MTPNLWQRRFVFVLAALSAACTLCVLVLGLVLQQKEKLCFISAIALLLLYVPLDLALQNDFYELRPLIQLKENSLRNARRFMLLFWGCWLLLIAVDVTTGGALGSASNTGLFLISWMSLFSGVAATNYYLFGKETALPRWWIKARK